VGPVPRIPRKKRAEEDAREVHQTRLQAAFRQDERGSGVSTGEGADQGTKCAAEVDGRRGQREGRFGPVVVLEQDVCPVRVQDTNLCERRGVRQ
jgi:hypothetical protein